MFKLICKIEINEIGHDTVLVNWRIQDTYLHGGMTRLYIFCFEKTQKSMKLFHYAGNLDLSKSAVLVYFRITFFNLIINWMNKLQN